MNAPTGLSLVTSTSNDLGRMCQVECDGVDWHVQVVGAGPEVVLIHGTGASGHSFRNLIPALSERFTVVVPDLPGHGRSAITGSFEPSLPRMAAALRRLLGSLKVNPRVVVGHSAGAAVLTRMVLDGAIAPALLVGLAAALYPLRGFERAVFASTARLFSAASQVLGVRFDEASVVRVLLESTGSFLDEEGVEHYRRLFAQPQHLSAVLAMMAHWDLSRLFSDLSSLHTPVLLLAGQNDRAIPLSQQRLLERRMPTSRLKVLSDAGHLLHEEQPRAVVRLILDEAQRVCGGLRPVHWGDA